MGELKYEDFIIDINNKESWGELRNIPVGSRLRRDERLRNQRWEISHPVKTGSRVAIAQHYTVLDIYDGVALCLPEGGGGLIEIPLSMLICV